MKAQRLLMAGVLLVTPLFGCASANPDNSKGAWAGDIKLCKALVISAELGASRQNLSVRLTDEGREKFAAMTRAMVGKKVEFRVNGMIVMAPEIVEPVNGGSFMVVNEKEGALVDFKDQALGPC